MIFRDRRFICTKFQRANTSVIGQADLDGFELNTYGQHILDREFFMEADRVGLDFDLPGDRIILADNRCRPRFALTVRFGDGRFAIIVAVRDIFKDISVLSFIFHIRDISRCTVVDLQHLFAIRRRDILGRDDPESVNFGIVRKLR